MRHSVDDYFSIVIGFAGICYGRYIDMRCKFNLVTYVQGPLVIDRRGGRERNKQKEITKYLCDSVNHTHFPKEDHVPD